MKTMKRAGTLMWGLTAVLAGCGVGEANLSEEPTDTTSQVGKALSFAPAEFPNNTNTFLAAQSSADGVVTLSQAYLSQHLYGQDLLLDLYVRNLGFEKRITVVNELTGEHWVASYAQDYWNHNASASWRFTTADGKDNLWVRVKGTHAAGTRYTVRVEMNGQAWANGPVVVGSSR